MTNIETELCWTYLKIALGLIVVVAPLLFLVGRKLPWRVNGDKPLIRIVGYSIVLLVVFRAIDQKDMVLVSIGALIGGATLCVSLLTTGMSWNRTAKK